MDETHVRVPFQNSIRNAPSSYGWFARLPFRSFLALPFLTTSQDTIPTLRTPWKICCPRLTVILLKVNYVLGPLYNRGSRRDVFFIEIDMQRCKFRRRYSRSSSKESRYIPYIRPSSSVKNNAIKDNPVSSVFFQFELSPPTDIPRDGEASTVVKGVRVGEGVEMRNKIDSRYKFERHNIIPGLDFHFARPATFSAGHFRGNIEEQ